MRSVMLSILHQVLSDHIKKKEVDGACGTYRVEERHVQHCGRENRGRKLLKD
jgi:hypothetical protein